MCNKKGHLLKEEKNMKKNVRGYLERIVSATKQSELAMITVEADREYQQEKMTWNDLDLIIKLVNKVAYIGYGWKTIENDN